MNSSPALALLEHALVLARQAIDDDGLLDVDHPAASDLCAILGATDHLLRRYTEALRNADSNLPF